MAPKLGILHSAFRSRHPLHCIHSFFVLLLWDYVSLTKYLHPSTEIPFSWQTIRRAATHSITPAGSCHRLGQRKNWANIGSDELQREALAVLHPVIFYYHLSCSVGKTGLRLSQKNGLFLVIVKLHKTSYGTVAQITFLVIISTANNHAMPLLIITFYITTFWNNF